MAAPLLVARDVRVAYGNIEAVQGVSLEVPAGEIVTVIGANGAGKSTLLAALMGMLPMSGEVTFRGESLSNLDTVQRVERGLCLIPETRELFASMTVEENLVVGAFRNRSKADFAPARSALRIYEIFPRLGERRAQVAMTLSGGERQMLAIGRALMANPVLLMLDEPSLGLAPLVVKEVFQVIQRLHASGVSILLIEQNARTALKIADHAYVLENGRIGLEGAAAEIAVDPRVHATYLGSASGARAT